MSDETSWVQYVTAIGAVATPILVIALTGLGWTLRHRFERRVQLADQLRDDRVGIYNEILEPFILLLTSQTAWASDPKNKNKDKDQLAQQKLLSIQYRQTAFKLSLIGSDSVVRAYNDLFQYFYNRGSDEACEVQTADLQEMMRLLGSFLLEIRRSSGNETTELDHWEMLEWFITDARKFRLGG